MSAVVNLAVTYCTLSRPGPPYDCYSLARFKLEADVCKDIGALRVVANGNISKFNGPRLRPVPPPDRRYVGTFCSITIWIVRLFFRL
jgi:hypothetical protein